MTRHMKTVHNDIYTRWENDYQSSSSSVTNSEGEEKKRKRIHLLNQVPLSVDTIKEGLLQLVTINGRPFSIINDSGLKLILDPILASLPKEQRITINAEFVKSLVNDRVVVFKNRIEEEVKERKLVCLKVDIATRNGRSFLAVNVQFIKDEKLVIRTLGIVELLDVHNGLQLKDEILKILSSFNITVRNIYSFTSDNASNMVKLCELLDNESSEYEYDCSELVEVLIEDTDPTTLTIEGNGDEIQTTNENIPNENSGMEEEMLKDPYDNNFNEEEESWYRHLCGELQGLEQGDLSITHVRCAAHTLQLAVEHAIKDSGILRTINKAREAVKHLRVPSTMKKILNVSPGKAKPVLDVPTRWHSSYDMLSSLLSYKDFSLYVQKSLNANDWKIIDQIVKSLEPAKIATKKLQTEQLFLTDFYKTWLNCRIRTEKLGTPLARKIVTHMSTREKKLFHNETILTALYLDPYVNSILEPDQREVAISHIQKLWKRLHNMDQQLELEREVSQSVNECSQPTTSEEDLEEEDEAEAFIRAATRRRMSGTQCTIDIESCARNFLNKYERDDKKESLIEFWQKHKFSSIGPLFPIAMIIHSTPATQVSVERLFSGLRFVFNKLRCKMTGTNINNVMIVRSNYHGLTTEAEDGKRKNKKNKK